MVQTYYAYISTWYGRCVDEGYPEAHCAQRDGATAPLPSKRAGCGRYRELVSTPTTVLVMVSVTSFCHTRLPSPADGGSVVYSIGPNVYEPVD